MDGNDFIQSVFTSERHRQFEREVQKDRLAKLVSTRANRNRPGALAGRIRALVRSRARRAGQILPARDV